MTPPLTAEQIEAYRPIGTAKDQRISISAGALTALCDMASLRSVPGQPTREAVIEECARLCDLIGYDWRDSGQQLKQYAAEYLAKQIRDLASSVVPASPQKDETAEQWAERMTPALIGPGTDGAILTFEASPQKAPPAKDGAWTCKACGFRGFWRGGLHCIDGKVVATDVVPASQQTMPVEHRIGWIKRRDGGRAMTADDIEEWREQWRAETANGYVGKSEMPELEALCDLALIGLSTASPQKDEAREALKVLQQKMRGYADEGIRPDEWLMREWTGIIDAALQEKP